MRGDVFLTRTSETTDELGMSSVALKDYPGATFNGFTKRLRPKSPELLSPEYLAYAFRNSTFRQSVNSMSVMSTRASLNNEMLARLWIPLPDLETQQSIGGVLKALDDKIELNRRINTTLEEMARALFKSWFVDFDPIHAKAEGRPTGLPPETDALFPDGFQDSEIGEIPNGWKSGTYADIAFQRRQTISPTEFTESDRYIGLEHMPRRSLALYDSGISGDVVSQKLRFTEGDVLFGKLRPYFHKVSVAPYDGICSTDILAINAIRPADYAQVVMTAADARMIEYVTARSDGTKMPRTRWEDVARFPVPIVPHGVATVFSEVCQVMFDRIQDNVKENEVLTVLRDTLLPKLLTGQITVQSDRNLSSGTSL